MYVRNDAPDDLVTAICAGLDLRRDAIPWEGYGPLPVADLCRDTPDGPLDVALHPAAERYWQGLGYRTGGRSHERGRLHELRLERPPRIRSMVTLEIASEILARAPQLDASAFTTQLRLRQQTADVADWFATIVTGDDSESLAALAQRRADVAIVGSGELIFREDIAPDVMATIRAARRERDLA